MKVAFHHQFQKKYEKLPPKIKSAFNRKLKIFLTRPFDISLRNHSVENIYPECRSINVTGDFRAIYRKEGETAIFLLIGSHSELYG